MKIATYEKRKLFSIKSLLPELYAISKKISETTKHNARIKKKHPELCHVLSKMVNLYCDVFLRIYPVTQNIR